MNPFILCSIFICAVIADPFPERKEVAPPQIIAGTEAKPHEFPWQARLCLTNSQFCFCGGSLISTRWVLTAAHCDFVETFPGSNVERQLNPTDIFVLFGAHNARVHNSDEQQTAVQNIILYKTRNYMHTDIALLKLLKNMHVTSAVHPIAIARPTDRLIGGDDVIISGWGHTSELLVNSNDILKIDLCGLKYTFYKDEECKKLACKSTVCVNKYDRVWLVKIIPDILQKVIVPVIPENECKHNFGEHSWCVGTTTQGGCHGDSGGPMVKYINGKPKLFGVTSYGDKLCRTDIAPGRFTKVNYFYNWIVKTMKAN